VRNRVQRWQTGRHAYIELARNNGLGRLADGTGAISVARRNKLEAVGTGVAEISPERRKNSAGRVQSLEAHAHRGRNDKSRNGCLAASAVQEVGRFEVACGFFLNRADRRFNKLLRVVD